MNIREYYLQAYPTDELGADINSFATFDGLFYTLEKGGDVYRHIGVHDSIVRERVFEKLAEMLDCDYNDIYKKWMMAASF